VTRQFFLLTQISCVVLQMRQTLIRLAVSSGFVLALVFPAAAAEHLAVVVGADAPQLERYAADELAGQFRKLFPQLELSVTSEVPTDAKQIILVGSPSTNAAVGGNISSAWPKLTDQGILLHSVKKDPADAKRQVLVVGGGSPVATLWAVYELGHRLGIRYLLRGDLFPVEPPVLSLAGYDVVMEPKLRSRTWRTVNDFAMGPESWSLEQHAVCLKQLAKLKYNRVMLSVYPWQPFISYEFKGVKKDTAVLWWGNQYRVDGDTVGKKVFRGARLFENPDFAGMTTPEQMTKAGIQHMQGLIEHSHRLGMTVGVSISPLEFPLEFQKVLPGSKVGTGLNGLTVVPAGHQGPEDPDLLKLVSNMITAWKQTYPDLDTLYLTLPEFPEWDQHAEKAFTLLKAQGAISDASLDELLAAASGRNLVASGARGQQAIRGNLVGLAFFRKLFTDTDLLTRGDGKKLELMISDIDSALFSVLDQIVPPGAGALNFVDYTARRVAENRGLLEQVPASKIRSQLIMTLADDNVGILPQSSLGSLEVLVDELKKQGWDGFSTRYWVPAELDSSVYFLSRAAWEHPLTAKDAVTELWTTATGNRSAAERLWLAWEHLENATSLIDKNDLGFTFPVPGMLMKHYNSEPVPEWWKKAYDAYTEYLTELYRAHGAINGDAFPVLFYYAKRSEYALAYFEAVTAVRESAIASKAGDSEKAIEQMEKAVESIYSGITAVADVATDQSDRGLVAILNEYAYRPLMAEFEKLSAE
jgi:hypothetical protein